MLYLILRRHLCHLLRLGLLYSGLLCSRRLYYGPLYSGLLCFRLLYNGLPYLGLLFPKPLLFNSLLFNSLF